VRSAERRHIGGTWLVRRDAKKVDVAGMRTKLAKGGRSSQVEAFNKARSLVIDGFQISIDDLLDLSRQTHQSPNDCSRPGLALGPGDFIPLPGGVAAVRAVHDR
jgi:hypothetical protein